METYEKIFLRDLIGHRDNLFEYASQLYKGTRYSRDELNKLLGSLYSQGILTYASSGDSLLDIAFTIKGKSIKKSDLRLPDKEELILLNSKTEELKGMFTENEWHFKVIHDKEEFLNWREEVVAILQNMYDRTKDKNLWHTLNTFRTNLNGMNDENVVMQMFSKLNIIVKRVDDYFVEESGEKVISKSKMILKQYDLFISHASADKIEYVERLYETISKLGVRIFYDSENSKWGDNWKKMINEGVNSSEFAIIVISKNYFGREWTELELREFLNRQNTSREKIILPLLHGITKEEFYEQYPQLSDIQAISDIENDEKDVAILFAEQLLKRYRDKGGISM